MGLEDATFLEPEFAMYVDGGGFKSGSELDVSLKY